MRAGWGLLVFACLVAVGGCRVDATVEARVSGRGGTVTARFLLDREAVAVLGGAVTEGVQSSDLRQAGWEISPVRAAAGGGAEIEARKAFGSPGDLAVVMTELAGPDGPLRGFRLDRDRSFLTTRYRLRGTADVGADAAAVTGFANTPDLPARLRDAGVDPGRVAELLADRAVEGLHLRLVVALPGKTRSWAVEPGSPQPVELSSSVTSRTRPALLAVAVVSGLAVLIRLRRQPAPS